MKNKNSPMPKDALLEIFVESLPARFFPAVLHQIEAKAHAHLEEKRLSYKKLEAFGTPRRLVLLIHKLEETSRPLHKETLGPPASLLKDAHGNFTPQASGFARAQGVKPEELQTVSSPRGELLAAKKTIPGEPAEEALAWVFPAVIGELSFPKSMVWESSRFRFGRPIRSILALYGKKAVKFSLVQVKSGRGTCGLSNLGSKPIKILEASKYLDFLKDRCILVDHLYRRESLLKSLDQAIKRTGGAVEKDEELIQETVFLTEFPVAVPGHFSQEYLKLPEELLSTVLKKQLKFFPVRDSEGRLTHSFAGVRDGISEGQKDVQEGYERVIEARLNDAHFFFHKDLERPLRENLEKLKGVTYREKLGNLLEKAQRVKNLSTWICGRLPAASSLDQKALMDIAELCYADLVSHVIGEFPELQGKMGGEYAKREGMDQKVSRSLAEFYEKPFYLEGAIVSLAAKLDTLAGDFSMGLLPTGSEDPHGLRRQAIGALKILLEKNIPLSLPEALSAALEGYSFLNLEAGRKEVILKAMEDFLWQRLEGIFEEQGFKFDEVRGVREGGLHSLPQTVKRLSALHSLRQHPDFASLAVAFKRASNILKQAKWDSADGLNSALLTEPAEKTLLEVLEISEEEVRKSNSREDYELSLKKLVSLKPAIDTFFDKVMVMVEEKEVKEARLSLLARLVRLFKSVADLSQIQ